MQDAGTQVAVLSAYVAGIVLHSPATAYKEELP